MDNLTRLFKENIFDVSTLVELSRLCAVRGMLSEPVRRSWRTNPQCRSLDMARTFIQEGRDADPEEMLDGLSEVVRHLKAEQAALVLRADISLQPEALDQLAIIRDGFRLSNVEAHILLLALLVPGSRVLRDFCVSISFTLPRDFSDVVAAMIEAPRDEVAAALRPNAPLMALGLLAGSEGGFSDLEDYLGVLKGLSIGLLQRVESADDLLSALCPPARAAGRSLSDFDHLHHETDVIARLLRRAVSDGASGVNILLYGPPGTGKTELARCLVSELQVRSADVGEMDDDGDPLSPVQRVARFQFSQKMLSLCGGGILLFDEIEQILGDLTDGQEHHHHSPYSRTARQKAWKVRVLEDNRVPSIWIANDIHHIDPALLRRFTFSLKVDVPPRHKRRALVEEAFGKHQLAPAVLESLAGDERLTPADVSRTANAVAMLHSDDADTTRDLLTVMSARPDGVRAISSARLRGDRELPYRREWLNTSVDLDVLVANMARNGYGRLGLFGPPGTGKTAFVSHLAEALGVRCVRKKASDLMSPYVGETEQKFAHAFDEVQQDHALLFLDEADSFLRSRDTLTRSWEFSQINELLTQIDEFGGFFVLASNYGDNLDLALARRLDIRVDMKPLRDSDVINVVREAWSVAAPEQSADLPGIQDHVEQLKGRNLTMGDVAAALRRFRLTAEEIHVESFVSAIQQTLRDKGRLTSKPIGFVV